LIEIRKLFKVLLFGWWVSNGDQHLKNFSLVRTTEDRWRLAPAYDLVCTRLPIPSDRDLALPVCGKKNNLDRRLWLNFAEYSQIPERAAVRLLREQIDALESSLRLIDASFLPNELKPIFDTAFPYPVDGEAVASTGDVFGTTRTLPCGG
jgi:serine/threonine-protein kinase HipA